MSYFKLDIKGLENNADMFFKYSKKLSEDVKASCTSLINSSDYWSDPNNDAFKKRVKNDFYEYNDFIANLENRYKEIRYFERNVFMICEKYGYKGVKKIKFDDGRLLKCRLYFKQCLEILNIYLLKLNTFKLVAKGDLDAKIAKKITGIKKLIKDIELLDDKINGFCKDINASVDSARSRVSKIEKVKYNVSLLNYRWSLVDPSFK